MQLTQLLILNSFGIILTMLIRAQTYQYFNSYIFGTCGTSLVNLKHSIVYGLAIVSQCLDQIHTRAAFPIQKRLKWCYSVLHC